MSARSNEAYYTGGIFLDDDNGGTAGPVVLSSTIVADNTAPYDNTAGNYAVDIGQDPTAAGFDAGFSLIEAPTGTVVVNEDPAGSNILGTDPQLGPLAANGGPTQTQLPATSSPAIDAGIDNGLTTDQRGLARTVDRPPANAEGSDGTDIGSVELAAEPPPDGGGGGGGGGGGAGGGGAGAGTTPQPTDGVCQGETTKRTDGTAGDDTINGTDGVDLIFGLAGDDVLKGVIGADCLNGDDGADNLKGGGGKDVLKGGDDDDKLRGQGGKDKLKGQDGVDNLNGGEGADRLNGGAGSDKLRGGPAKDRIKGAAGADKINAVDGKADRVNCGAGNDKATVEQKDKVSRNCEKVSTVD